MKHKHTRPSRLPHHNVFTRLAPSRKHGVGVFAIRKIRKGTYVFLGDDDNLAWVAASKLRRLPKSIKRLYQDFCIITDHGKLYGCPKNFNLLTVPWYLNDSRRPNVGCDKNYRFFALRDIRVGEELTADYRTYNQFD